MKWVKMPGDPRSVDDELKFISGNTEKAYPKQDATREKKIRDFREKVDGMCNRNHDAGFKERSKLWVKHPFKGYFETEAHYRLFRIKYESFIGGYLYYYDNILRNEAVDHGVRFEWKEWKQVKDDDYAVAIFLDPPPGKKVVPKIPVSTRLKSTEAAPLPDDEELLNVDPPKPPAPPPPAM